MGTILVNPPILSLQEMALVKVAFSVCNDPDIVALVKTFGTAAFALPSKETYVFLKKEPLSFLAGVRNLYIEQVWSEETSQKSSKSEFSNVIKMQAEPTSDPDEDLKSLVDLLPCKKWEELVQSKISTFSLPKVLQDKLFISVRLITIEIEKWIKDHFDILRRSKDFQIIVQNLLQWNSKGRIDRLKTANTLITTDRLPDRERYVVAYDYCFKAILPSLWDKLDAFDREFVPHVESVCSLEDKVEDADWLNFIWRGVLNPDELRRFFMKLNPKKRAGFLRLCLHKKTIEYEDFFYCFTQLDDEGRENIKKVAPCNMLEYFLDPPLQNSFLDLANHLMPYLFNDDYIFLLHAIIFGRIVLGFKDFDYVGLLKKLWANTPDELKNYVSTNDFAYGHLMFIIQYKGPSPFPHEKLLDEYKGNNLLFVYLGVRYCVFKSEIGHCANLRFSKYNRDCKRAHAVLYAKSAEKNPESFKDRHRRVKESKKKIMF